MLQQPWELLSVTEVVRNIYSNDHFFDTLKMREQNQVSLVHMLMTITIFDVLSLLV